MTANRAPDQAPPEDRPPRSAWDGPPTQITVDFANLPNEPRFPAAESAVLGAVMLSPSCAAKLLPILRAEHFTSEPHRDTLAAIQTLQQEKKPIDPVLVHDQLRKDSHVTWGDQQAALFVHDCIEAAYYPGNGTSYATTVLEYAVRRRAVQAGVRIAQVAAAGRGELPDVMKLVAREINQLADESLALEALGVDERGRTPLKAALTELRDECFGRGASVTPAWPAQDRADIAF